MPQLVKGTLFLAFGEAVHLQELQLGLRPHQLFLDA